MSGRAPLRVPYQELTVQTPPLAYHDPQFIDSDDGRPIRIVSEYLAPLRTFRDAGVSATVVFFGSARARSGGPLGATTMRQASWRVS